MVSQDDTVSVEQCDEAGGRRMATRLAWWSTLAFEVLKSYRHLTFTAVA